MNLTPNGLEYPQGCAPGFDPTHIASTNVVFSGIASNGNVVNVLSGLRGTIASTGVVFAIDGTIGPAITVADDNTSSIIFPVAASQTDASITMAAITYGNGSNDSCPISIGSANSGPTIKITSLFVAQFLCYAGSTATASVTITAAPWFIAASNNNTICNIVARNLTTGQVLTSTSAGITQDAHNTSVVWGASPNLQNENAAPMAAGMYSTAYMSMPQLLAWAANPWAFWYPPTALDLIYGSAQSGSGVALSARGWTKTFGLAKALSTMPALASGRTDTFGRGLGSFAILASAKGETLTFGRSSAGVLMPVKAAGLTETKGSAKSLVTMPAFASGRTDTFGRVAALLTMPVSAAGRTETFGRAAGLFAALMLARGETKTFGRIAAAVVMPAFAAGRTDTFGKAVASVTAALLTVSGRGLTTTFGRAAPALTAFLSARGTTETFGQLSARVSMPMSAQGRTETFGRAQSLNTASMAARGETQSYGRGSAAFFARVSARGATETFGRAQSLNTLSVAARGEALTFGRSFASVLMPVSARGLTETFGRATPTVIMGMVAVFARGLTTTSGRATALFSAFVLGRGATMTFGAAGATVVAPLLTVSASGQTMTFGQGVLSSALVEQPRGGRREPWRARESFNVRTVPYVLYAKIVRSESLVWPPSLTYIDEPPQVLARAPDRAKPRQIEPAKPAEPAEPPPPYQVEPAIVQSKAKVHAIELRDDVAEAMSFLRRTLPMLRFRQKG